MPALRRTFCHCPAIPAEGSIFFLSEDNDWPQHEPKNTSPHPGKFHAPLWCLYNIPPSKAFSGFDDRFLLLASIKAFLIDCSL